MGFVCSSGRFYVFLQLCILRRNSSAYNTMVTQEDGIILGHHDNNIDGAGLEVQFKKDKSRTKANFTHARNSLLTLLEEIDLPSRREVNEACGKMGIDIINRKSKVYRHF